MGTRLLNFNRFMSNFSTKLVGGFVPIIVYKYAPSHKMLLALLTCVIQYIFSFIVNIFLKNQLVKRPQVFLFLRLFPVILYEVLLLFVDVSPILCVVGIGVGFSLSYVFKLIPTEVLFAYNNATKKSGTGVQLALSKLIDQTAMILGTILGGVALDYWDMRILIIISIILYFIGSFPILLQYFIHRKEADFNQEYSTYAHMALKEQSYDTEYANMIFEILNAKGKELASVDLIKNAIFETLDNESLTRDYNIGTKLSESNGYPLVRTTGSVGGYSDYVSAYYNVPAYTIEVGSSTIPHPIGREYLMEIFEINKNVPIIALESVGGIIVDIESQIRNLFDCEK